MIINVIEIRATSRQDLNMSDLANPTSTLQVIINVVAGDLFIEFAESDYYVNTPKAIDMKVNFQKVRAYQFNELRNIADPSSSLPTSSEDYRGRLEAASIFFSRAHLIQRKSKRSVRFSVELVQFARKGSSNFQRLPLNTVNTTSVTENQNGTIVANKLMQNALDLKLDSERVNLFDIDSYTGKVLRATIFLLIEFRPEIFCFFHRYILTANIWLIWSTAMGMYLFWP